MAEGAKETKEGREVRKEGNVKKTSFKIREDLERKLKLLAIAMDTTVSSLIDQALEEFIEKHKGELEKLKQQQ